jgi:hypothetical protein
MHNEFILQNSKFTNEKSPEKTTSKILRLGNDSLFFFGIFLAAITLFHFVPYITGIFEDFNIGINEVAVSVVGLLNVFFYQLYNKLFKKVG